MLHPITAPAASARRNANELPDPTAPQAPVEQDMRAETAEMPPEPILLNPLCRITPDHSIYSWSAATYHSHGLRVSPQLLSTLRNLNWPRQITEFHGVLTKLGFSPPSGIIKSLMETRVLIGLSEHRSNLSLLKGTGRMEMGPFLLNEHSIEYLRAALRLGLEVVARDPATIEIFNSTTRHTIDFAGLVTFETEESVRLSYRKDRCTAIWRGQGLPVPRETLLTVDRLHDAPEFMGFPLVVKPIDGGMGADVFANVNSPTELSRIQGYFSSRMESRQNLLVQEFVRGVDHRLLVVGGKMIAAAMRLCPFVVGDGISTVRQLVPCPTVGKKFSFTESGTIESMMRGGYTPDTILPRGEKANLNFKSNYSTGGFVIDISDSVHPTIQAAACKATESIGLKVAGVDFICEEVSLPLIEGNGRFIEINDRPGLVGTHLYPSQGTPRFVCDDILRFMFQIQ